MSKPNNGVTPYSVSKIACYETCPRQYQGKYLQGIKDKPGPAAKRGNEIHLQAEHYLNGNIRGLPDSLKKLDREYKSLKRAKPLVELKLAVTEDWEPCGFFDDKAWARGVLDVVAQMEDEMIIIDHKTGRIYDYHVNQAEMYAALLAASTPSEYYNVEFWYTDQGETRNWEFSSDDIPGIRKKWDTKAKNIMSAKKFHQTPSDKACKYCPVATHRGGPCNGWKKVK